MLVIPSIYLEYISVGLIYTDHSINFIQNRGQGVAKETFEGTKKGDRRAKIIFSLLEQDGQCYE
jgi:hypothetical protein